MNTKSYIRSQSHIITLYRYTHMEGKKRMGKAIHVAIHMDKIDTHTEPIGVAYKIPDSLYDDIMGMYTDFLGKYKTLFDSLKTSWQEVEDGKCYIKQEDGHRSIHKMKTVNRSFFDTSEDFISLMGEEMLAGDDYFLQLGSMADCCPNEAYEKARKMFRICHTAILDKLNEYKESL